jgi:hypothetical protein
VIYVQAFPRNLETTCWLATAVVCVVINAFPGSLLAAAGVCYLGGFHVRWDTISLHVFETEKSDAET